MNFTIWKSTTKYFSVLTNGRFKVDIFVNSYGKSDPREFEQGTKVNITGEIKKNGNSNFY